MYTNQNEALYAGFFRRIDLEVIRGHLGSFGTQIGQNSNIIEKRQTTVLQRGPVFRKSQSLIKPY